MELGRKAAVAAAAAALVAASPTAAMAGDDDDHGDGHGDPVSVVAEGLDGPRQLSEYQDDDLVVAESDTGEVSRVDRETGEVETLLSGLGNVQGVDYEDGHLYVAVGEAPPEGEPPPEPAPPAEPAPPEEPAPPAEPAPPEEPAPVEPAPVEQPQGSVLLVATPDGEVVETYDLLQYELDNNPDEQVQLVDGQPVDALSNPFSVLAQDDRVLVADAGANAVLSIDLGSGEISTFFVPPSVTGDEVAACGELPNNDPETFSCDPVPTEITEGYDGKIYLGTLGAEVPGAGRVYVLEQDGELERTIEGLTGVTGVAVDHDGAVFASELFEGAPAQDGPPPADFDPSVVGQIVRIDEDDERSTAQVTLPTGLELEEGELYASAWSVAGFLGMPGRGEVVQVDRGAFTGEWTAPEEATAPDPGTAP